MLTYKFTTGISFSTNFAVKTVMTIIFLFYCMIPLIDNIESHDNIEEIASGTLQNERFLTWSASFLIS